MNIDKSREIQEASFQRRWNLRQKKTHDYATDVSVLSNFKRMSDIMKIWNIDITTPWGVALFYSCLKVDRFCNLVFSDKAPANESLQDTIDDLKNYIDLMEECLIDAGILIG